MTPIPGRSTAVVLGAGPAGLAAAAELKRVGIPVVVLDKADRVGSSWAGHYDRLHLHTSRGLSGLPGYRIPRRFGRWVARDGVLAYLAEYADLHGLDVRLGVTATSVERGVDEWRIAYEGAEGTGTIAADIVVVATGYNHTAKLPDWPGLDAYTGKVVHSSAYKNPAALEREERSRRRARATAAPRSRPTSRMPASPCRSRCAHRRTSCCGRSRASRVRRSS